MPSISTDITTDNEVNSIHNSLSASELRVVLVCDVVESVRWMEHDEDNAITRWQAFANHVREHIAPAQGGTVAKSTGDGLMMEFANARSAVQAATAMHQQANAGNAGVDLDKQMHLRTGIHEASIRRDAHDIYGHGVNLAARITTLAGPGEVIVSAPVRDHLTDGLDGDIQDMGECYLKHVSDPQRVYRVGVAGNQPILLPKQEYATQLQPTIAVIPFKQRSHEQEHFSIGELIADGVIAQLGQSKDLKVISRLSTSVFRDRPVSLNVIQSSLESNYVLTGAYVNVGNRIVVTAELADAKTQYVVWSDRITGEVSDLVQDQSLVCQTIATRCHQSILDTEVKDALSKPVPTIASYGLLLSGIHMMHRSTMQQFARSIEIFDHLVERHPRSSAIRAWRAKWRLMKTFNGMSADPKKEAHAALEDTFRSLDADESHPLTLAIQGQIYSQLFEDSDKSIQAIDGALHRDKSETLAWLFKSAHSVMWGNASNAVNEVSKAIALSALDPQRYLFDMFYANALLADNRHVEAIVAAKESLRANSMHTATVRILLTAQFEINHTEAANQTLSLLRKLQPNLSLQNYRAMGSASARTRLRCLAALKGLGVDES